MPEQSPIEVSLIELVENADNYDNCRVRVRGEYFPTHPDTLLVARDPKTQIISESIILEYRDDDDVEKEYRKWKFSEMLSLIFQKKLDWELMLPEIPWLVPLPINAAPAEQRKAVFKASNKKRRGPLEVLVIGRFDYAEKGRLKMNREGKVLMSSGYGHSGYGWPYRIVVENIVIVKKKK